MTFEEKLEKLAERHEALARFLELLAHSVHEQGVNIGRILTIVEAQTARIDSVFDALNRLTHLADSHERRLQRIEGEG